MELRKIAGNEVLYSQLKYDENIELREILDSQEFKTFLQGIDDNIFVVLGGDGTLLEAIQENYHKKRPFLGINFGNKGFLLNDIGILKKMLKLEERNYPLLEMCIDERLCAVALNEFDIKA